VPTVYRTLEEIAKGRDPTAGKLTAAVNTARRFAWSQAVARHGKLPGVKIADKTLEGVTCIRLDATVTFAHSGKELACPGQFQGFRPVPLLAYCDNTREGLAWMLRPGSAGSNTTADHLQVLDAVITAVPARNRRRLMVTCDDAGASHGLIARLDAVASRPGRQLTYSVGWELGERERTAIRLVPAGAWHIATDARGDVRERRADDACGATGCAHPRCWVEEAHVTELTGLLREDPDGDQLAGWPDPRRLTLHPARLERAPEPAGLALPAGLHRRRAQGPRPGRGPDPYREGLRDRPLPVPVAGDQLRVADRIPDRRHPAGLAPAPGPRRRPGPHRAENPAPHPARRRPTHPRRPPRQLKVPATWPWATAVAAAWTRITALPQAA
jgi:hypothetical protein